MTSLSLINQPRAKIIVVRHAAFEIKLQPIATEPSHQIPRENGPFWFCGDHIQQGVPRMAIDRREVEFHHHVK